MPLSSRICECLVPYFDSSSSDSRNVSLVPGCVFVHLFTSWLVFGPTLKYCLKACGLLINMQQEQNNVSWQWCKTVDFSCVTCTPLMYNSLAMVVFFLFAQNIDWSTAMFIIFDAGFPCWQINDFLFYNACVLFWVKGLFFFFFYAWYDQWYSTCGLFMASLVHEMVFLDILASVWTNKFVYLHF